MMGDSQIRVYRTEVKSVIFETYKLMGRRGSRLDATKRAQRLDLQK